MKRVACVRAKAKIHPSICSKTVMVRNFMFPLLNWVKTSLNKHFLQSTDSFKGTKCPTGSGNI